MASVIENYRSNLFNSLNDWSVERKKEEEEEEEEGIGEPSYPFLVEDEDLAIDEDDFFLTCYSDPLIEVSSVIISPQPSASESFLIYGQICVEGSEGAEKVVIYDRPEHDPQTITSQGPSTLLLTTPVSAVIKMDRPRRMLINLEVQGVCFAKGSLCLDEPTEPGGYHEIISLTLNGNLGDVEVNYICMPFARIGKVIVTFTDEQGQHDSHDSDFRSSSPDAHISGKITAHYTSHIGGTGTPSPTLVLFHKEHAPVHYGVPVNLCRSLLCIPCYSRISLKLDGVGFVDRKGIHKIVITEDVKFSTSGITHHFKHKLTGNLHVTVKVDWSTTDDLEVNRNLWGQSNLGAASASCIAKSVIPKPIEGYYRIQVLSVFVGHGGKEQVDICGTVAVDYCSGSCYLFKAGNGRPRTFIGKSPTLEGLTSYPGDSFTMVVRLNDVGMEHVDIKNCFTLYDMVYLRSPGNWFNRPLCHVLLGKKGFAAVHFILFGSAVKATVKISVVLKDSNAPCSSGSVNGTLVARYSNCEYLTKYQRKYWSIDLLQVKDKQSLSKDGEISLLRDVVSVSEGSSLILHADLYVSSGSDGTCVDHFVNKVEIGIGDVESRLQGQTYDVVVSTKWESG